MTEQTCTPSDLEDANIVDTGVPFAAELHSVKEKRKRITIPSVREQNNYIEEETAFIGTAVSFELKYARPRLEHIRKSVITSGVVSSVPNDAQSAPASTRRENSTTLEPAQRVSASASSSARPTRPLLLLNQSLPLAASSVQQKSLPSRTTPPMATALSASSRKVNGPTIIDTGSPAQPQQTSFPNPTLESSNPFKRTISPSLSSSPALKKIKLNMKQFSKNKIALRKLIFPNKPDTNPKPLIYTELETSARALPNKVGNFLSSECIFSDPALPAGMRKDLDAMFASTVRHLEADIECILKKYGGSGSSR